MPGLAVGVERAGQGDDDDDGGCFDHAVNENILPAAAAKRYHDDPVWVGDDTL